ncbi:hypothetical protein ACFL1X_14055, partial [Candidatus Hydrogenedentota bacterium]
LDDEDESLLTKLAQDVLKKDKIEFKTTCVMICSSRESMNKRRDIALSDQWPRGFFISLDELRMKCEDTDSSAYLKLCCPCRSAERDPASKTDTGIATFNAKVVANIPIGEEKRKNHRKLSLEAPELARALPGQFIMMDTAPGNAKKRLRSNKPVPWNKIQSSVDLDAGGYLKRPFGIHRAFYRHFEKDYLKNLALPPTLATIVHTVRPNKFDILYKILDDGVGTREMEKLREGDEVSVIGPLGKRFDLRKLRADGVDEVHLIGGGVGMAPLVFMVQALRLFAFKIKVFMGVENLESLRQSAELDITYAEEPKDICVYVKDLRDAGLRQGDIFVSCEKTTDISGIVSENRFHKGFVSEQ